MTIMEWIPIPFSGQSHSLTTSQTSAIINKSGILNDPPTVALFPESPNSMRTFTVRRWRCVFNSIEAFFNCLLKDVERKEGIKKIDEDEKEMDSAEMDES